MLRSKYTIIRDTPSTYLHFMLFVNCGKILQFTALSSISSTYIYMLAAFCFSVVVFFTISLRFANEMPTLKKFESLLDSKLKAIRNLLKESRKVKNDLKYKLIWSFYGRTYLRKDSESPVVAILNKSDLDILKQDGGVHSSPN